MDVLADAPLIYKYRSISSHIGLKAVYDALRNSQLWWQSPRAFNDPFDCAPPVIFGKSPRDRRQYSKLILQNKARDFPRHRRVQMRKKLENMSSAEAYAATENSFAGTAMSCFSVDRANILMWSHYAENHSGVCLAFQQMVGTYRVFVSVPVIYSDDRPVADIADMRSSDHRFLETALLTKARCWEYEQEQRMFEIAQEPGLRAFPRQALIGLIFGAQMRAGHRRAITRMVRKYRPDIELLEAKLDPMHYRVIVQAVA